MNKYLNLGLFGLFVIGGVMASGIIGPLGSIIQANVYDAKGCPAQGSTNLCVVLGTCKSYNDALNLALTYPSGFVYPDSSCPGYPAPTTTTVSTSTLAYCGTVPYNPQTQACSSTTIQASSSTSAFTSTSTSFQSTSYATATTTSSGTTVTNTATIVGGSGQTAFNNPVIGLGLSGFSLIGLIFVNRKGIRSAL